MCITPTRVFTPGSTAIYTMSNGKLSRTVYVNVEKDRPEADGKSNKSELMIIPVPIQEGTSVKVLEMRQAKRAAMIDQLSSILSHTVTKGHERTRKKSKSLGCAATATPLEVQEMDGYLVSVTTNFDDLLTRVDVDKFNLDPDVYHQTMEMMGCHFRKGYGYVLAVPTLSSSGEYGGALVVEHQAPLGHIEFPTVHESSPSGRYDYDVDCLYLGPLKTNVKSTRAGATYAADVDCNYKSSIGFEAIGCDALLSAVSWGFGLKHLVELVLEAIPEIKSQEDLFGSEDIISCVAWQAHKSGVHVNGNLVMRCSN